MKSGDVLATSSAEMRMESGGTPAGVPFGDRFGMDL